MLHVFSQDLTYGLGDGQITGRHHHDDAVTRSFDQAHLTKGADLIDTGVGTRVRQKNKAGIEPQGYAISHMYLETSENKKILTNSTAQIINIG
ncbi:hypothetical protein ICHIJ1_23180 [Fluviibacter phosphoraccumulans]|uniref:Uncharacterized protein n=1 Tax=Fluviibacter phosphoraccumulans TaxID=1751046 RepID=A0A679ICE2_9RHOO|nr:hypothetical protein ICHIAU1_07290 [Fluviibacter phosphoraccumulans]BBU72399.1 hypothetical protein ICHIJ1_23180 [Fluviibacter phosphoraccumulans]BCA66629.1 hypothetical protein SHINM1_022310 [Fluviibacter phosphoraccumulans]